MAAAAAAYDRQAEVLAFDNTKSGVKGLVDAGATTVPRIFQPPSDEPIDSVPTSRHQPTPQIPVVELLNPDRAAVVEGIRRASSEWGFFQVVGHGIPAAVMAEMIERVRRFHEGDRKLKEELYSRENFRKVKWSCNFDLFESRYANWRDTLFCDMAPVPPEAAEIPESCRDIMIEYSKHVSELGETLFELLSEALGLKPTHLKDMECCRGHNILSHYYPPCPEPSLTLGTSRHADPSFLTVLLQDHIGGLQVIHDGKWVDVPPLPGAFVVNIGDLLQLISNDKFRSVEHRVLANNRLGPRISVACFFRILSNPLSTRLYGPILELLSAENPPLYNHVLLRDYLAWYYERGLDGFVLWSSEHGRRRL